MSNTIIKISRSKYIEESLNVALIKLDTMIHYNGVLCMINYYISPSHTSFDTVFASGVKDGIGRDCYRIISLHQDNIIWGVTTILPDVSRLVHGEKYLWKDESGFWWVVNAPDGITRQIVEVPKIPTIYTNLSDYLEYVVDTDGIVRRITDIYSRGEIDSFIDEAKSVVRYVDFNDLTPSQKEQLRGPKGDVGEKGETGSMGLQGPQGIRGYNGSIENFVVLSERDYQAILTPDPYKFYFTYEDEDQPISEFFAYVEGKTLVIDAEVEDNIVSIDQQYATYDNQVLSIIETATSMVSTPTISPLEGTYHGVITVDINCSTPDSEIRYTVDRSEPTVRSRLYTGPITLDYPSTTIKARAFKPGLLSSYIAEARYDLEFDSTVSAPIISPDSGLYIPGTEITLSSSEPGVMIRYTTDLTEPNETSPVYMSPIIIEDLLTVVRARGFKPRMNASETVSGVYEMESQGTVEVPTFNIPSGTYTDEQIVIITTDTPGAIIRYTLDGSDPTSDSNIYTEPILITEDTTIKAKGFKVGMTSSNISSISITISEEPGPEPSEDIEVIGNILIDNTDTNSVIDNSYVIILASVEGKTLIF